MRIALAQLNPTVGDLAGNVDRMTRASRDAAARGAEAVVFPELSLTGYPPRDLVEKPSFIEASERELERLASETRDLDLSVICGYVGRSDAETGKRALNRAALIERGEVVFRQSKMLLPNYDVFDEARYFRPAEREYLCTLRGVPVALTICEDAWNDRRFWKERLYQRDPGGRIIRGRRADADLHQRVALQHGQARHPPECLSGRRAALWEARGLRESGGRQRSTGLRRHQLRHERRR